MKTLPILTILALGAMSLASSPAIANQKQAIVDVPPDSRLSCDDAIANVKQDLTQRGFLLPLTGLRGATNKQLVRIDETSIQTSYFDYPSGRTNRVIFVLRKVTDLYSSPKLMATLASQIMADCNNVGMVSFAYWVEGSANVGFFPDNTARTFINLFAIEFNKPREERGDLLAKYSRKVQTPNGVRSQLQWGYDYTP